MTFSILDSALQFVSRQAFVTVLVLGLALGCDPGMVAPSDANVPADQLPPTDISQLDEWLAARSWETWDCEAAPHPATGTSPHGMNRICQNVLVTDNLGGSGDFPVGATLVKETFDGGGNLFALFVETRVNSGTGADAWYFLRRETAPPNALVENAPFCAGCHSGSPRDFVWSTVP